MIHLTHLCGMSGSLCRVSLPVRNQTCGLVQVQKKKLDLKKSNY